MNSYLEWLKRALMIMAIGFASATASAAYPDKPIRLVIPFPPGGSTDLIGRMLSKSMSEKLGQPVIVENLSGAGGTIGVQKVIRSEPDGYTVVLTVSGAVTLIPSVNTRVKYSAEDLQPIGMLLESPLLLVVQSSSPYKTLADLLAKGKGDSRETPAFGSSGIGAISHVAAEMINIKAGTKFMHVPYKGTSETLQALMTNDVQWALISGVDGQGPIHDGRLRPLAVMSKERSPTFPSVPTMEEQGVKGVDVSAWYALLGPRNLPPAVVALLNRTIREIVAEPEFAKRAAALGSDVPKRDNTPAALESLIKTERDNYLATVRALHLSIE